MDRTFLIAKVFFFILFRITSQRFWIGVVELDKSVNESYLAFGYNARYKIKIWFYKLYHILKYF